MNDWMNEWMNEWMNVWWMYVYVCACSRLRWRHGDISLFQSALYLARSRQQLRQRLSRQLRRRFLLPRLDNRLDYEIRFLVDSKHVVFTCALTVSPCTLEKQRYCFQWRLCVCLSARIKNWKLMIRDWWNDESRVMPNRRSDHISATFDPRLWPAIFVLLDKKIVCNFKTTDSILVQLYLVCIPYANNGNVRPWSLTLS